jgi:hypothetical protein
MSVLCTERECSNADTVHPWDDLRILNLALPERVSPGDLVRHLIVGEVMNALRSLGKRELSDQNREVVYQGNAEFYRVQVHTVSTAAKTTVTESIRRISSNDS